MENITSLSFLCGVKERFCEPNTVSNRRMPVTTPKLWKNQLDSRNIVDHDDYQKKYT